MKSFIGLFHGFCVAAILAGTAHSSQGTGEETPFVARYDFYIGGLSIAEISFDGMIGTIAYEATSVIETRGILELLVSGRVTAAARGYRHTQGHLSPDTYATAFTARSEARKIEISYLGETATVSITPPEPPKPYDTRASAHPGALDPLTAAVTMMNPRNPEDLCNRTIPVFDGKRRYDIVLLPLHRRPEGRSPPLPNWRLPTTRCFGVYERLAGFEGNLQNEQRYFPFDIWFEHDDDRVFRIVRVAGKTKLGYAIGTLRP